VCTTVYHALFHHLILPQVALPRSRPKLPCCRPRQRPLSLLLTHTQNADTRLVLIMMFARELLRIHCAHACGGHRAQRQGAARTVKVAW